MSLSIVQGFTKSLAMTVLSEIGDKTFFAAAILAMRHPRRFVLAGCLGALIVMTILSALVGWAAPNLVRLSQVHIPNNISRKWTHHITTLLFLGFGFWSLWDAFSEGESEDLAEVEAKCDIRHGFSDRILRDNHQLACPYKRSPEFGNFNEVKPVGFPQPFVQAKRPTPPPPVHQIPPPPLDLSGIPEDGQRMINELMSFYDDNVQGNNRNSSSGNSTVTKMQPLQLPSIQCQSQPTSFMALPGNIFEETNMPPNHSLFSTAEEQLNQGKIGSIGNCPFNATPNENFQMMFSSPFNMPPIDYIEGFPNVAKDNTSKADVAIWY